MKYKCIFTSGIIFLVSVACQRADFNKTNIIGVWKGKYISKEFTDLHKIKDWTQISSIEILSNGQFKAVNFPVTYGGGAWTGTGDWDFETKNTPRPDGTPMLHLTSSDGSCGLVDCWIKINQSLLGKPSLEWFFDMEYGLKAEFMK